jgi:hypothetical protein
MTTKPTPKQRAVIDFWSDELQAQMLDEDLDDEPSLVGVLLLWACGLVAVCLLASLMVSK